MKTFIVYKDEIKLGYLHADKYEFGDEKSIRIYCNGGLTALFYGEIIKIDEDTFIINALGY